jgi:hypothetical protein
MGVGHLWLDALDGQQDVDHRLTMLDSPIIEPMIGLARRKGS